MGDLSKYMKEVKQWISRDYNKKVGRVGTLWEDRPHSLSFIQFRDAAMMPVCPLWSQIGGSCKMDACRVSDTSRTVSGLKNRFGGRQQKKARPPFCTYDSFGV